MWFPTEELKRLFCKDFEPLRDRISYRLLHFSPPISEVFPKDFIPRGGVDVRIGFLVNKKPLSVVMKKFDFIGEDPVAQSRMKEFIEKELHSELGEPISREEFYGDVTPFPLPLYRDRC